MDPADRPAMLVCLFLLALALGLLVFLPGPGRRRLCGDGLPRGTSRAQRADRQKVRPVLCRDESDLLHRLCDALEAGDTIRGALSAVFGQAPDAAVDQDKDSLEAWLDLRLAGCLPHQGEGRRHRLARRLALVLGICEESGSRLVPLLEALCASEAHRRQAQSRKERALAVPQATVRLFAVLPSVLLVGGTLLGADPLAFLITPMGLVCLAVGIALIVAGILWYRRVIVDYEKEED